MAEQFTLVWQTENYLKSLARLTRRQPALRLRVLRLLQRYYGRPESLQRTIIHNPKRRIFHTRLDKEKRLIDEPLDPNRPNEIAILYVDHHDSANRWAASYKGDTQRMIEKAVGVPWKPSTAQSKRSQASRQSERRHQLGVAPDERAPAPEARQDVKRATRYPRGSVGEYVSARKLRELGVRSHLLEAVLRSSADSDLMDSGLEEKVAEGVYAWYSSKVPLTTIPRPVPALERPEAIPVTRGELRTVLSLSLSQLLSELTDEQRALARRENRNLYVVKGAAGSGKTVIGVRRIQYLCEQRELWDRPIIFICYNKVLANAARQMIEDTLQQSLEDTGVEVWAAYEFLAALQAELGIAQPKHRFVSPERLLPLLARVRRADSEPELRQWSDRALLDEILEVIYGRGVSSLAEYRATNRRGRGRPLRRDGRERATIWMIHERLRALCDRRGIAPWDDLPLRVLQHLAAHPPQEPRYSGVIVDEAQDLLPSVFQVLLRIQAGRDENVLVLGDAAQNVYRSGFRWGHTGLNVSPGQVTHLRRCFRSTPSIIGAAIPLINKQQGRLEKDLVVPEGGSEAGPKVEVSFHRTLEQELDDAALNVEQYIRLGVPPSSIAVLVDDGAVRTMLRDRLTELECRTEDFLKAHGDRRIDIFDQSVKLLSVASAKGTEFQVVYVPTVTEATYPSSDEDGETADRARRVLYTAMTRCAWQLHLSAHGFRGSGLILELDQEHVEYTGNTWCKTADPAEQHQHTVESPKPDRAASLVAPSPQDPSPSTVAAVMRQLLGREIVGGPPRFRENGWSYSGMSKAICPACAAALHILRKPYTTVAGQSFRYWAIACPGCGTAHELAAFDSERQKEIRQS